MYHQSQRCNMAEPTLPYDPEVDNFGTRTFETESGETITYEEAFQNAYYVKKALKLGVQDLPIDFTMYVLRKMAVNEKYSYDFEAALPRQAHKYLKKLIGRHKAQKVTQIHPANYEEMSSTFRGTFTQVFCRKVISNATNQVDDNYDRLATVFPFKVSQDVRWSEIKITKLFDGDFYQQIKNFLDRHFENVNAPETVDLFLLNIRNFISETFSAESLLARLNNPQTPHDDYLSTFPRLHQGGIDRFQFLYREFVKAMEHYRFRIRFPAFYRHGPGNGNNKQYFRELPERNFADLYSFLDDEFFQYERSVYVSRFQKYLFFFVHALKVDSNPVFFIDDMLFECLKSLRRYKTVKKDVNIKNDLAMISMLHYRMNLSDREKSGSDYHMSDATLERMKKYILESVIPRNPRLNVKYKTDLLVRMPFRTDEACFKITYTKHDGIKNIWECIISSVLFPENEPVSCIINYNAFLGKEYRLNLPSNVEFLRNFVRLCSLCDVSNESVEEPNHDVYILSLLLPFIETEKNPAIMEFE
ncbi:uncharacterized protein LOC135849939 isoform X2 [Planococcus citri]|uniref:uncharacterized protein LOC135849939 isoform X2 n=1 Tax=Planococcus citri TaxID=170843 RepID=UPI0031F813DF